MADNKKILHIEALLSAISSMQIACEPSADSDLGFKMWGGKDSDDVITRWLAKGKNAQINDLQLIGDTTTGDTGVLVFDTDGNITGDSALFDSVAIPDGEIAYGNVTDDGLESDSDFTWDDSLQSLRAGTNCAATGNHSFAMGDGATASGNYSEALGISVTASGGASKVKGASTTVSHDYAEGRGNGVRSVWPGASHFGGDQISGNNSSQCMGEMALVAETDSDTEVTMKFNLSDSNSPLYCPDECVQSYHVRLMAASKSGTYEGIVIWDTDIVVMRTDPDFNAWEVDEGEDHKLQSHGDANFTSSIYYDIVVDAVNYCPKIDVFGISGHTIYWIANITRGVQLETNYYSASTGG